MKFSFTSLGCSSALPTVNSYPSAHVLNVHERLFLIDCGEGCQMQMRRYGISILKIDHIFVSHIHGDHIFGIYGLLSTMSMLGRLADIFIYAPEGFAPVLKSFLKYFGDGFKYNVIHKIVNVKEKEVIFSARTFEVYAFPLNHRIDCYGYLFSEKDPKPNVFKDMIETYSLSLSEIAKLKNSEDVVRENGECLESKVLTYRPYKPRSFAYCSDTAPFAKLKEYVNGVDILYHEATFASNLAAMAAETMHSTAEDAARTALEANVKMLIIGHFSSRYRETDIFEEEAKKIFKNSHIAEQGMEFDIPLEKHR